MTPAELLDSRPVHNTGDVGIILALPGIPSTRRAEVRRLVRTGAIALVDPTQCVSRWTISRAEIYRYINEGPRTGADVIPLRAAS
jgi:DNA invertase Pin-like site-specific DNA recombinase